MEEGYSFVWNAGKNPWLVSPSGQKVKLTVHGNVPYLVEWKQHGLPAAPVPDGMTPVGEGGKPPEVVEPEPELL